MTTILLVEDEADIAEVLRDVLEMRGHRAILAFDGREGLERARQEPPDAVVTDLMMPEMSGEDFIARLRELRGLERVPVVAISAAPYHGDEPFMRKPFDVQRLMALVESLLARVSDR